MSNIELTNRLFLLSRLNLRKSKRQKNHDQSKQKKMKILSEVILLQSNITIQDFRAPIVSHKYRLIRINSNLHASQVFFAFGYVR